jgi:hypothetical protein
MGQEARGSCQIWCHLKDFGNALVGCDHATVLNPAAVLEQQHACLRLTAAAKPTYRQHKVSWTDPGELP